MGYLNPSHFELRLDAERNQAQQMVDALRAKLEMNVVRRARSGAPFPKFILRIGLARWEKRLAQLMSMTPEEHASDRLAQIIAQKPAEFWNSLRHSTGADKDGRQRTFLQHILCFAVYGLGPDSGFIKSEIVTEGAWHSWHEAKCEAAMRSKYFGAVAKWNEIERRAKAHGIRFSGSLEAHHRMAILDYLDNPEAPTHVTSMIMTRFSTEDPRHPHEERRWARHQVLHYRLSEKEGLEAARATGAPLDPRYYTNGRYNLALEAERAYARLQHG